MSVKACYLGVLIGGLILGLGWAHSCNCPGTGVAATGRIDARVFLLGGLVFIAIAFSLALGQQSDNRP